MANRTSRPRSIGSVRSTPRWWKRSTRRFIRASSERGPSLPPLLPSFARACLLACSPTDTLISDPAILELASPPRSLVHAIASVEQRPDPYVVKNLPDGRSFPVQQFFFNHSQSLPCPRLLSVPSSSLFRPIPARAIFQRCSLSFSLPPPLPISFTTRIRRHPPPIDRVPPSEGRGLRRSVPQW